MTEEELKAIRKIFDTEQKKREDESFLFWSEKYPSFDDEQRIGYWSNYFRNALRECDYSTTPPDNLVFNKAEYDFVKNIEPEIDRLLPFIAKNIHRVLEDLLEHFRE
jgi:hypothetical protein